MKIRSLLLGSLAIAGLSSAGYAADLGVVTSLDVCDELGLSGLTISSDNNCLVITGGIDFEYDIGDYDPGAVVAEFDGIDADDWLAIDGYDGVGDSDVDLDVWLKFVATADTDFGPATATIKLVSNNNDGTADGTVGLDEAWVGIGDTTVIMAGYKSSIFNDGDDVPLNYLGLFLSEGVGDDFNSDGVGPYYDNYEWQTQSAVIQVVSNLGNGLSIGAGIESLGEYTWGSFTAVGTLAYAGEGLSAHVSGAYDTYEADWNVHAGFTGTWDPITVVGAVATDDTGYWNALGSVALGLDIFKIALSGEATSENEFGVGGSIGADVSEGVTLNLGGRYFTDTDTSEDVWQAEAAITAAVAEGLSVTAGVGAIQSTFASAATTDVVYYGTAGLAWAPGGGFDAGISATVNTLSAWKIVTTFSKTIN